jgi:hypothetical protein
LSLDIETELNLATSDTMVEQVSYEIWATVVSCARAFGKVEVKIHGKTQRIFIAVHLRWWAKKVTKKIQDAWIYRAEQKVKDHVPRGWNAVIYYKKES